MLEESGPERGGPYRRPGPGALQGQTAAGPADGPGSGRPSAGGAWFQGPPRTSGALTNSPSTQPLSW